MKTIALFVLAAQLLTSPSLPQAVQPELQPEISRSTYIEQYSEAELFDMVVQGKISENEFTKLEVARTPDADGEVIEVSITELKERRNIDNTSIESFNKKIIANKIIYDNTSKAAGSTSTSLWYKTNFLLTITVDFDRLAYLHGSLYKLTKYSAKISNVSGRLEFPKLEMYCACSGDAFSSATTRVGYKGENSSWAKKNPLKDTTYFLNTGFQYYYNTTANSTTGGANATLTYTYSNKPPETFFLNLKIFG